MNTRHVGPEGGLKTSTRKSNLKKTCGLLKQWTSLNPPATYEWIRRADGIELFALTIDRGWSAHWCVTEPGVRITSKSARGWTQNAFRRQGLRRRLLDFTKQLSLFESTRSALLISCSRNHHPRLQPRRARLPECRTHGLP